MKTAIRALFFIIIIGIFIMANVAVARFSFSTAGIPSPTKNPRVVERYSPHSYFFYYGGYMHGGGSFRGTTGGFSHK